MSDTLTHCPNCGAKLTEHPLEVTWCDACNWNIDPNEKPPAPGSLNALATHLNEKHARALRDDVLAHPEARPGRDTRAALAILFAVLIHLPVLACGGMGLFTVVRFWPYIIPVRLGVTAVATALRLLINIDPVPKGTLPRAEHPALFGLVDRIAAEMGVRKIDLIALNPFAQTSIGPVGFPPRPLLTLSYPLLFTTPPQQVVALIAGGLAHLKNGDLLRIGVTGNAWTLLFRFSYAILPASPPGGRRMPWLTLLATIPLRIAASLSKGLANAYYSLTRLDSQRAAYLADRLTARVAGAQHWSDFLADDAPSVAVLNAAQRLAVSANPLDKKRGYIDEVRACLQAMSPRERERLRRVTLKAGAFANSSLPPTQFRVDVLNALPRTAPPVVWTDRDHERLQQELKPLEAAVASRAIDLYREYIGA